MSICFSVRMKVTTQDIRAICHPDFYDTEKDGEHDTLEYVDLEE
jgi:hypothetical protein